MNKTKVAILGCGFIAHIHASSYQRFVHHAEVVAVYTRRAEKASAGGRPERPNRSRSMKA